MRRTRFHYVQCINDCIPGYELHQRVNAALCVCVCAQRNISYSKFTDRIYGVEGLSAQCSLSAVCASLLVVYALSLRISICSVRKTIRLFGGSLLLSAAHSEWHGTVEFSLMCLQFCTWKWHGRRSHINEQPFHAASNGVATPDYIESVLAEPSVHLTKTKVLSFPPSLFLLFPFGLLCSEKCQNSTQTHTHTLTPSEPASVYEPYCYLCVACQTLFIRYSISCFPRILYHIPSFPVHTHEQHGLFHSSALLCIFSMHVWVCRFATKKKGKKNQSRI